MTMRAFSVFLVASVWFIPGFGGLGCTHLARGPDGPALTHKNVEGRLRASAARRNSVEGVIKARLPGLAGVVVNATLDFAARAPGDLSVSVRSFFDMPQQVFTSGNGEAVLYDATTGAPRFFRGPATEQSLARVLGVPLAPDDAAALLLGRPPVEQRAGWPPSRLKLLSVDPAAATYNVQIERPGRGHLVVTARASDDALLSAALFRGDGRQLVSVRFDLLADHDGVAFAHRIAIVVSDTAQELVLEMKDVRFNQPLSDEVFALLPPADAVVLPL